MELDPRLTGKDGFKNFIYLAWQALGLPDPTPVQYDISDYVSNGPRRRMVQAFRGVGKSYITSAYVVWRLLLDPALNFLVVSASKQRADDFSTFTLRLIEEMGVLTHHLIPGENQRNSKIAFDVAPAPPAHAPSVTSKGVYSAITGARADVIIADDVESWINSQTQTMRDKLSETIKEYDAILKPGGEIIYLGTPQTEQSIYRDLPDRGFQTRIWPAQIPTKKQLHGYGHRLAKSIRERCEAGERPGTPLDPKRFDAEELTERELSYGRSLYALQFMLDQTLSDLDRYPLKINDLIVMDVDNELCPEKLVWCNDPGFAWDSSVPCVGFNGDRYYRPSQAVGEMVKYQGTVMAIDPSGAGADQTAWAVVKCYGGQLFCTSCGGLDGGFDPNVLKSLSITAKKNKVNLIIVEENFGQGMFVSLLTPVLHKIHRCGIEEVRHSIQKERRIADVLEPVCNSHKLILDRSVIIDDIASVTHISADKARQYQLMYQFSRLTRQKGALRHDDKLDALSMAVQYWVESMARDVDRQMEYTKDVRQDKELARFMEHTVGRKPREPSWLPPRA